MATANKQRIRIEVEDEVLAENVAALIAVMAHRKQLKRWKMTRKVMRELVGRPLRTGLYRQLDDALVEYGILIMNEDSFFSFILTSATKNWTRMNLTSLSEDERRKPNIKALEAEFAYKAPDLGDEDDEEEGPDLGGEDDEEGDEE